MIGGKFEVQGELGRGGMGVVYRVRHRELGKIYALKVLSEELVENPELVARFRHEAQVMARLRHPNIVEVFDIDRDGDLHYFVMEFIAGRGLDRVLAERGCLSVSEATGIAAQVAQALAYAHRCEPPVVHRDIKPANILIENGSNRVVVTDFGIAKLLDEELTRYTRAGAFLGTLRYSSPEQVRGDVDIDPRADIYSLGLLLYEMIAGRAFFKGLTDRELIGELVYKKTENMPRFETVVPAELQRIITKAIAKDRSRRYPTTDALMVDLAQLDDATGVTVTQPLTSATRRPRPVRRATLIALPILLAVGAWVGVHMAWQTPEEIAPAPIEQNKPGPKEEPGPNEEPAPAKIELRANPAVAEVVLDACTSRTFEVLSSSENPSYRWQVDGQRRPEEGTRLTLANVQPGPHVVRVEVTDASGAAARSWQVVAQAPAVSNAQVQAWLQDYRQALLDKRIDALRTLGFVRSEQQAQSLRSTLESRQQYDVVINDVQIEGGQGSVQLRFQQMDRWYDPTTFSTVIDHAAHALTLELNGCTALTAR